jgi:hypothetical protein
VQSDLWLPRQGAIFNILEINTSYYHIVQVLYGLPHGILHVFNTILYENEFQNSQIFQQTIRLFPEQSTLLQ